MNTFVLVALSQASLFFERPGIQVLKYTSLVIL